MLRHLVASRGHAFTALLLTVSGATALAVPLSAAAGTGPACRPAKLSVSFQLIPDSQGAGQVYDTLVVRNTGTACTLGRPSVELLGKAGRPNPSHSTASGKPVTVPAGGKATATAKFSPDVNGTGDSNSGICQPVSYAVKVSFKGSSGSVTGPIKPPTSVCERGSIFFTAFKASR